MAQCAVAASFDKNAWLYARQWLTRAILFLFRIDRLLRYEEGQFCKWIVVYIRENTTLDIDLNIIQSHTTTLLVLVL